MQENRETKAQTYMLCRSASTPPISTSSSPSITGVLRRKSWTSWRLYFYSLSGIILREHKIRKKIDSHSSKPYKTYSLDQFQLILVDANAFNLSSPADTIYFRATDDRLSEWVSALKPCCLDVSVKFKEPLPEIKPDLNITTTSSDPLELEQLFKGVASEVEALVSRTLDESLSLRWSEVLTVNQYLRNQLQQARKGDSITYSSSSSAGFNRSAPDISPAPRAVLGNPSPRQEALDQASRMDLNINRIEIGARIHTGGGSAATIYLATVDGWQCVVKELQCSSISQDVCVRFEKELATLESLPNHENLARYLFHNRTPTQFQIFTTRYDTTLTQVMTDRINFRQPFTLPEIIGALIDITRGVEILHRHEILHRDLKPDNIFVTFDRNSCVRRYIVGDFDSAKNIRLRGEACTFVGTLTHMAPEIFSHLSYGSACDIWSIGIIIYELLTFELRDSKSTPLATMFGQKSTCLEIDSSHFPASFSGILEIFDRCHQVTPALRPTAASLLRSLLDCLMKTNDSLETPYLKPDVPLPLQQPSTSSDVRTLSNIDDHSIWQIEKEIGIGAGGVVHQVRHAQSHILGAMKKVLSHYKSETRTEAEIAAQINNLKREAEILKLLDHPNVIKLYDFFESNNGWYLVTEFVDGGELLDRLLTFPNNRIPEDQARTWFRQLVSGIQYCHDHGIVHRDLKLENILIDSSDQIRIADFGFANFCPDSNFYFKTLCGSAKYAPPEIFAGAMYRGPPSDIWALGIILFVMLSGEFPWKTEAVGYDLMNEVISGRFQLPSHISEVPASMIKSILLIDPDDRLTASQLMTHPWLLT